MTAPRPRDPAAGVRVARRKTWSNHAGNVSSEPLRIYYPSSVADLVAIVQAAAAASATVRALGSAHAWSDAAVTTGFLVETRGLNRMLEPAPGMLPQAQATKLVRVEAGIRVRELNAHLDRMGLALANMGGYDGQTIAGVISTSTHGSGIRFGPLSSFVRALELVIGDGSLVRIEPGVPLVDPGVYRAAHPEVRLIQDDEYFNAAVVGVGCMGIIHAVTLEVVPRYWLKEVRTLSSWTEVSGRLRDGNVLRDNERYEILINPYRVGSDNCCLVTTRNTVPERPGKVPKRTSRNVFVELAAGWPLVTGIIGLLFDLTPRKSPERIDGAMKALVDHDYTDVSYRVMNIGRANFIPSYSSEIGVPMADGLYLEAVERIIRIARSRAESGLAYHTAPISLRFVRKSDAFLSMMEGRDTMMIELIMLTDTEGGMELLSAYEGALYDLGGRPHWGQVNSLNSDLVTRLYPQSGRWRKIRAQLDPAGRFDSPFAKRTGLSAP